MCLAALLGGGPWCGFGFVLRFWFFASRLVDVRFCVARGGEIVSGHSVKNTAGVPEAAMNAERRRMNEEKDRITG